MTELKLLSDAELAEVEQYKFLSSGEARVIDILLDHITALTEQHARDRAALAKDSYQLGHAAGDFIQRQDARIKTLETALQQIIDTCTLKIVYTATYPNGARATKISTTYQDAVRATKSIAKAALETTKQAGEAAP